MRLAHEGLSPDFREIAKLEVPPSLCAELIRGRDESLIDSFPECFTSTKQCKIPFSRIISDSREEYSNYFPDESDHAQARLYFAGSNYSEYPFLTWTEDQEIPDEILSQLRGRVVRDALFISFKGSRYLVAHTNWPGSALDAWIPTDHDFLFLTLMPSRVIDFRK